MRPLTDPDNVTDFRAPLRRGWPGSRRRPRTVVAASAVLMLVAAIASPSSARVPAAVTAEPAVTAHPSVTAHAARACANADRSATSATISQMRAAVVCLIDQVRAAHHLPALNADNRLNGSAQAWSNSMVAHHEFTHGANFARRISAAGFKWSAAGENIATGYKTPRQVVNGWMASTGHCQNILSPTYRDIGTGVNRHAIGGFDTGPATWTQDFALPMGRSAPSGNWGPAHACPY